MDYGFISEKIARLRADLTQKEHHTEYEMVQQQKRQERLLEIKAELEAMMKR